MKKILIPIIGLLVLIILTPIILGKMANSNIDKKIEEFKKAGIIINEESKNISYLNTKRVFEVELNQNTNIKDWNEYKQVINKAKFLVTLTFKNLPITKANFDIKVEKINAFNQDFLENLHIKLQTKNFKNISYKIDNYDREITLEGVYGDVKIDKYKTYTINSTLIKLPFLSLKEAKLKFEIKDLKLGIMNIDSDIKEMSINQKYKINIKNLKEKFEVHLKSNKTYTIKDVAKIEVISVNKLFGIGDVDSNLTISDYKEQIGDILWNFKWQTTQYQKSVVGGGDIKVSGKFAPVINDINLDIDVRIDKDLFDKLSLSLNPEFMNQYFKDYKSHIKINKGIFVNGNRIQ